MSSYSNNHNSSTGSGGGSNPPARSSPPRNTASSQHQSTIFNVGDKDLMIIDPEDIAASTANGSVKIVTPMSQQQTTNPPTLFSDVLKNSSYHSTSSSVIGAGAWGAATGPQQQPQSNGKGAAGQHNTSAAGFPELQSSPSTAANNSSGGGNIDLADILHGSWPDHAGSLKDILKTPTAATDEPYASNVRVRSMNPLKHLGGTGNNRNGASGATGTYGSHYGGNTSSGGGQTSQFDDAFGASGATGLQQQSHKSKSNQSDRHYDNVPLSVSAMSISNEPMPDACTRIPNTNLEVGSMIEVSTDVLDILYGVIKWIGMPAGHKQPLVGVELESELIDSPLDVTNGRWHGLQLFKTSPARGIFVAADQCSADRRFGDPAENELWEASGGIGHDFGGDVRKQFGDVDCPIVAGIHAPMSIMTSPELANICGSFKGIQGHHNSCYLDATLFGMFAFSRVFDAVLYRPADGTDIEAYADIQTVLRDEIVNPLRTSNFVRADRVLRLRKMLEEVCSVKGLTSEEKDPEEFLNILLAEALKAEPFLKLNSGQDAYCYQLFVDKDERLRFPSVQQLFDQSFLACDIKLQSVPNCLIVQMPRFGKDYKMYPRILPSQVLDVTDVIENSPRQCCICGQVACLECKDCFDRVAGFLSGNSIEEITFCEECWPLRHDSKMHKPRRFHVPDEFLMAQPRVNVPRIYMELFAVVCIETSHYVSFVKTGAGESAPWCFFDSMADRQGGQNGCNIPQLVSVEELPEWISEQGARELNERAPGDKQLPKLAKRLLCDAYLCMYQSTDMLMYQ